jgi:large subunit ribosomal protein L30
MARLRITQTRSTIGALRTQRATLRSLGLKRIRDTAERDDDPVTRGMIAAVSHLVCVEEVRQ